MQDRAKMNVAVKVITNARKREANYEGSVLKVRLTALPRDGKANDELVDYLSELLKVRRSEVKLIKGEKDRRKVVSVPVDEETFLTIFKKRQELQ
jgi:uncharacterized protein